MGILSFLTKKKSKSEQESKTVTDVEQTASRQEAELREQTGTTTTTGLTSTTGVQTAEQFGTREAISDLVQSNVGTTGTKQQLFSDPSLGILEDALGGLAGATGNLQDINNLLSGLSLEQTAGFDPARFVSDALAGAQQQFEDTVLPQLGVLESNIGGTAGSNSAAALLRSRAQSENAARLAGVRTQATAQAQDIGRQNLAATSALSGANVNQLTQIAEILRGAISTGETEAAGEQVSSQQDVSQTSEESIQTSSEDVESQQTQVQQLLDIVVSLLEQQGTNKVTETFEGTNTGSTRGSILDVVNSVSGFISALKPPARTAVP